MSVQGDVGPWSRRLQLIGSVTSIATAVGAVIVFFFSTPLDVSNFAQVHVFRHTLSLTVPVDGAAVVNGKLQACGTADLRLDWVLVVLTQTPAELRYYVSSGGAITVRKDGKWALSNAQIGSPKRDELARDTGKNFKVIVLALDELGQRQLQPALAEAARTNSTPVTNVLPHYATRVEVNVHPILQGKDTQGSCSNFIKE